MIDAQVTSVLDELRSPLQADGADLELEGISDGIARVRLVLGPETCTDCIMARPILEQIMMMTFSRRALPVAGVELIDPRES